MAMTDDSKQYFVYANEISGRKYTGTRLVRTKNPDNSVNGTADTIAVDRSINYQG